MKSNAKVVIMDLFVRVHARMAMLSLSCTPNDFIQWCSPVASEQAVGARGAQGPALLA